MKMTKKHKVMAYILNTDMGYTQTAISDLMKVAQSTVQRAVKDITYEQTIHDLSQELNVAKQELHKLGYEPPSLPANPKGITIDM